VYKLAINEWKKRRAGQLNKTCWQVRNTNHCVSYDIVPLDKLQPSRVDVLVYVFFEFLISLARIFVV
jgi:hypothetical protein